VEQLLVKAANHRMQAQPAEIEPRRREG